MATAVSPHISPGINIDNKIEKTIAQAGISEQFMTAPKSPLPKQKLQTLELPPVFTRIAYCESRDRQFDADGNVLRGTVNSYDVGRYQINTLHWADDASKLGYDLHTEEGNEAMALYIYKKLGTKPWRSSQKCWDKGDQAFAGNQ